MFILIWSLSQLFLPLKDLWSSIVFNFLRSSRGLTNFLQIFLLFFGGLRSGFFDLFLILLFSRLFLIYWFLFLFGSFSFSLFCCLLRCWCCCWLLFGRSKFYLFLLFCRFCFLGWFLNLFGFFSFFWLGCWLFFSCCWLWLCWLSSRCDGRLLRSYLSRNRSSFDSLSKGFSNRIISITLILR